MQSHTIFFIFVIIVSLFSAGFAEDGAVLSSDLAVVVDSTPAPPSFPYIAQMTGNNILVRSGPGTQYYHCGKLSKGDKVRVVDARSGWSRIIPPPGSFSWISKRYVLVDSNDIAVGIVTSEGAGVYVGSEDIKPIHSDSSWLTLNKGEKVDLLGETVGDYYKIAPPAGAYRWVSTEYTKPIGAAVGPIPLTVEPTEEETPVVVIPTKLPVTSEKLNEYYALEQKIKAERTKPESEQDYTELKESLLELSANKEADKASRYALFALKQIEHFELALEVATAVELQDEHLRQTMERIEKARLAKLSQVAQLGRFAVVGEFRTSEIYGQKAQIKHFRMVDESGQTLCYALPSNEPISDIDLDEFIGLRVGLIGTVEPHVETSSALVRFIEIVPLN